MNILYDMLKSIMKSPFKKYRYAEAREQIRSGDILMCSGTSLFSKGIQLATKSKWSHVGILLKIPEINRIMVLESVETRGVQSVPLSSYVKDYNGSGVPYAGELAIYRHKLFKKEMLPVCSEKVIDLLGYQYDNTEILRISWRIATSRLFKKSRIPKDNKLFICSECSNVFFTAGGIPIKPDARGFISPACFPKDPNVEYLFDIC